MKSQQLKTGNEWKKKKYCDPVPHNSGSLNECQISSFLEKRIHSKTWLMMLFWEVQSQDIKKERKKEVLTHIIISIEIKQVNDLIKILLLSVIFGCP